MKHRYSYPDPRRMDIQKHPHANQYMDEVHRHREAVWTVWNTKLRPAVELHAKELHIDAELLHQCDNMMMGHDLSSLGVDEFTACCTYWYRARGFQSSIVDYRLARLHHVHTNKHHWQYWNMRMDNGDVIALEMDKASVIEMICDWGSHAVADPTQTAHAWYASHQNKMVLHPFTQKLVEALLEICPEI